MTGYRRRKPRVGDRALHVGNHLDSRPVAEVSDDRTQIRLQIGTLITDWLPASNYVYRSEA